MSDRNSQSVQSFVLDRDEDLLDSPGAVGENRSKCRVRAPLNSHDELIRIRFGNEPINLAVINPMAKPTERQGHAEFIARIRAGDAEAAEELVRLYEPEIRLEIRGRLRLRNPRLRRVFDSIDICQSVLASFFVRAAIGEFDLEDSRQLVPLLIGMARNKLAQHVRYHQRQRRDVRRVETPEAGEGFAVSTEESPSQVVSNRELLDAVRGRLTEDERRVAELRAQGADWEAVALALGGTSEARRKQLSRAVQRVSKELGIDSVKS